MDAPLKSGERVVVERVLPYRDGRCQFLADDDRCTIYDDRPLSCRQFECTLSYNTTGVGRHGYGSITAIYTVLAEGDDAQDPIVDIARASLDGQVMLSRKLADAAHYPAIDLNGSISRVMQNLLDPADLKMANRFRRLWSLYQQNQDLISVGAYEKGSSAEIDEAIALRQSLENFLRQDMHISEDFDTTRREIRKLLAV